MLLYLTDTQDANLKKFRGFRIQPEDFTRIGDHQFTLGIDSLLTAEEKSQINRDGTSLVIFPDYNQMEYYFKNGKNIDIKANDPTLYTNPENILY